MHITTKPCEMLASITVLTLTTLLPIAGLVLAYLVRKWIDNKESPEQQMEREDNKIEQLLAQEGENKDEKISIAVDDILDDVDRLRRSKGEDINQQRENYKLRADEDIRKSEFK